MLNERTVRSIKRLFSQPVRLFRAMSFARSPFVVLIAVILVLFLLAIGIGSRAVTRYQAGTQAEQQLLDSMANIRYFDEALTMSARMGALTGDLAWERRYFLIVPLLDGAIASAIQLRPELSVYLDQVSQANERLIAFETESFVLLRKGRQADAAAIMFGEPYQQGKAVYSDGLARLTEAVQALHLATRNELQVMLTTTAVAIAVLFLTVLAVLLYAYRLQSKRLDLEKLLGEIAKRLLTSANEQIEADFQWVLAQIAAKSRADQVCLVRNHGTKPARTWQFNRVTREKSAGTDLDQSPNLELTADFTRQAYADTAPDPDGTDADASASALIKTVTNPDGSDPARLRELGIESCLITGAAAQDNPDDGLLLVLARYRGRLRLNQTDLPILESIRKLFSQAIAQQSYRDHLFALATSDALTSLANRRYFFEILETELRRRRRYDITTALLMIDLDHFKVVNDTYGHAIGDAVLVDFAIRIRSCIRDSDIIGRLGGEEFGCILPNTNADGAERVAERIRRSIAGNDVDTAAGTIHYSVSIGATLIGPTDQRVDVPLHRADQALYQAKAAGRNRVCWQLPEGQLQEQTDR